MVDSLTPEENLEGILPINKPEGQTSFHQVALARKQTKLAKVGHAGTLDPFASGVLILLLGKRYTSLSDSFLNQEKEYVAQMRLGFSSDTYDREGEIQEISTRQPSMAEIESAFYSFQGEIEQVPPMFSAKKVGGKKLYLLARQGQEIPRAAVKVTVALEILEIAYPFVQFRVTCSKGTYIRSLAHDIGSNLGVGAYLTALQRTRSGSFTLDQCLEGHFLSPSHFCEKKYLQYLQKPLK